MGADLSAGFETFDKHDDSGDEHLDSLLRTIAAHEQQEGKKIDAQIVTWRGMMTKVGDIERTDYIWIVLMTFIDHVCSV